MPSLDVDDLMDELRARAGAARRSHEQLEALLDAVTAVSADLQLAEVLSRIVRSACALVNARYGALGVLGPDGEHLMEFITHGVTPQERQAIGEPPRGHGILGLLIRHPSPQRLAEIGSHPESYGFPPNHPAMHSFLGVPVRIRDEVFGNLYLAEKQGEKEFSEADEAMLVALAAAAGVAIDNARLYDTSQRQRAWAQAIGELTQSLLESDAEDSALGLMAEQVCRHAGAELCAVALTDEQRRTGVRAVHAQGRGGAVPSSLASSVDFADVAWREALGVGQVLLLLPGGHAAAAARVGADLAAVAGVAEPGPVAVVPITAGSGDLGHLLVMWGSGQDDLASSSMEALSAFAQQAGLGLVAARAQQDRALVALLEDRDRIARDMHDHVIQRLFATGLSLQAAARLATHPVVRSRLEEAVDNLDFAIKDIRSTIFELHTAAVGGTAREQVEELVGSFKETLGFSPSLTIEGDLDGIDDALVIEVLAVVREALSNVARHAQAQSTTVMVTVDATLCVEVVDDGLGVSDSGRRSGLDNLAQRATARSGHLHVGGVDPHGTRVAWTVPVER